MKPAVLRWVPQSVCARFQNDVDQVLARWGEAWNLSAVLQPGVTAIAQPADWQAVGEPGWLPVDAHWGPWLHLPADFSAGLQRSLFPGDINKSAIAPAVAERAANQLVDALKALLRPPTGGSAAPPAEPAPTLGHSGLRYEAQVCGQYLTVLAGVAWLEARGWLHRPAASAPLAPAALEAAVAPLPVSLAVEVGSATLSVSELQGVGVGDVVLSGTRLDAPLRLRVNGSDRALPVFLGHSGPQRAVQVPASSKKQ